jgi:hypothetical protein
MQSYFQNFLFRKDYQRREVFQDPFAADKIFSRFFFKFLKNFKESAALKLG